MYIGEVVFKHFKRQSHKMVKHTETIRVFSYLFLFPTVKLKLQFLTSALSSLKKIHYHKISWKLCR